MGKLWPAGTPTRPSFNHLYGILDIKNSGMRPFWPSPLFKSQLVKDGEDFLLKAPQRPTGFLDPIKFPFRVSHHNRMRLLRKRSYGGKFLSSSNQSFSSGRGKSNLRGFRGLFRPHSRDKGVETPPPLTPLKPPSVHQ